MNILRVPVYRENIFRYSVWLLLIGWNLVITFRIVHTEPIIVAIDENETRLLSKFDDPILKKESENFLKTFFNLFYGYDSKTYLERVGKAVDFLSEELYELKSSELGHIAAKLEKVNLVQEVTVSQVNWDGKDTYYAIIELKIKERMNVHRIVLKVTIRIRSSERQGKNPWGKEIYEYSEEVVS